MRIRGLLRGSFASLLRVLALGYPGALAGGDRPAPLGGEAAEVGPVDPMHVLSALEAAHEEGLRAVKDFDQDPFGHSALGFGGME